MKRILDNLRIVVISFEALWVVGCFLINTRYSTFLGNIAERVLKSDSLTVVIWVAPVGLLVYSMSVVRLLLSPDGDRHRRIAKWPDFPRLWDRTIIALAWCSIAFVPLLITAILKDKISVSTVGFAIAMGLGVSVISTGSLYFASLKIKWILDSASPSE